MNWRKNLQSMGEWLGGESARRAARWLLPNPGTIMLIGILIWVQMAGAAPWARPALQTGGSSTTTINYQGRLANSAGEPIDGNVGMDFALYDAKIEGNLLWGPEGHTAVPISDGLFSVKLGSQSAEGVPTDVLGGDVWLEITVAGETLTPREKLSAVPYAMMARTVPDGAITTEMIKDGAITSSKLEVNLCCGHTNTAGTDWDDHGIGIVIDMDTSACNFPSTPMYFTSLVGDHHWTIIGTTSIYSASENGFTVFVRQVNGEDIDPADADSDDLYIQWCGVIP